MAEPELSDDEIVEHYLEWCEAEEAQGSADTPPQKAWATMAELAEDDASWQNCRPQGGPC